MTDRAPDRRSVIAGGIALATELATMPPEKLGFARTTLVRGQNRLVAALDDATELVNGALP